MYQYQCVGVTLKDHVYHKSIMYCDITAIRALSARYIVDSVINATRLIYSICIHVKDSHNTKNT